MNIISGQHTDLIAPFPPAETRRVFGWNHCYRTLPDSDDTPTTQETFTEYVNQLFSFYPAWGVIDKDHLTNDKHEAPLVGVVMLEGTPGQRHAFLHFASGRRAFKVGLVEDALATLIPAIFSDNPALLRLGAYVDERNAPAKALFRRLGFRFEGSFADMTVKDGEPRAFAYFGLTRRNYEATAQTAEPSSEVPAEPVEVLDNAA